MFVDWLDQPWPQLHRIVPNSPRFPELTFWGESDEIEKIKSSAGAYILVALDPNRDGVKRQTLQRLFVPDETGTLYIGGTGNLASRLGELGNAVRPDRKGTGHGLKRLRQPPWSERFPAECLAICWFCEPDRTEAHKLEARFAMDLYAQKFGERPPFDGFK